MFQPSGCHWTKTLNRILYNAYGQLEALPPDKALVLLHPIAYHHQRQLVYAALSRFDNHVYLALGSDLQGKGALVEALETAFQIQLGLQQLKLSKTVAQLATQLAQLINAYPQFLLVLDQFDRLTDSTMGELLAKLVPLLKPQHHILLGLRSLPTDLLTRVASVHYTMLPQLPQQLLVNYAQQSTDKIILEVHALGPSQAFANGRSLDTWDGVLPKSLFFYLIDRALVMRPDIFTTFWPNLPKHEATNVFHVTKRKINEMVGQDLTTYRAGYYHLSDKITLYYDVMAFQTCIQQAQIANLTEDAQNFYEEAIRLYRGHFLSTLDMSWINERRKTLQGIYAETLGDLAALYQAQNRIPQAINFYHRALASTSDTIQEAYLRELMQLYVAENNSQQAIALYHQMNEQAQSLGWQLSVETHTLADTIRQSL